MQVEDNNNTTKTVDQMKQLTAKRATTTEETEDSETKIKRLKHSETETHVQGVSPKKDISRAAAQCPKKRLQVDNNKNGGNKSKFNKNDRFMYGNYKHYYGKRILDKDFHDIRLDVLGTQPELFKDKKLLDIGCNNGHLSIEIARKFQAKSLTGLDIDRSLTQDAQSAINNLKRSSQLKPGEASAAAGQFPFNVKFQHGNYVLDDDVLLEIERPQFDVILCLSVTKWIHLNFCDAGLKQAFRRIFLQLRAGGKLILEPQSFDTYKRRKKLSDKICENYNTIKFKPEHFTAYLLSAEVGFASMELMGVPEHCEAGFKRPIQIFNKA